MAHVTQDIKCQRCNEVRAGFLQKYCECTGLYENLVTNEEMSQLVRALKNFIKYLNVQIFELYDFIFKENSI